MMMANSQKGFTLLELMIAMSVFAIMSTVAYMGLDSIMRSDAANKKQLESIGQLQRAFMFLERDLRQAQPRKARISYDQVLNEMLLGRDVGNLLELTVGGNPVFSDVVMRSSMKRIRYVLEDEVLYRYQWQHVDYSEAQEPLKMKLLDQVQSVNFVWLDENGKPKLNQYENQGGASGATNAHGALPTAIQLEIEVESMGKIVRLLPVYVR